MERSVYEPKYPSKETAKTIKVMNGARTLQTEDIQITPTERVLFELLADVATLHRQSSPTSLDLLGNKGSSSCFILVAGGFARDKLLGLECNDIDIIIPFGQSLNFLSLIKSQAQRRGYLFKTVREPKNIGQGACRFLKLSKFEINLGDEIYEIDMRDCESAGVAIETDPKSRDFTINTAYFDPISLQVIDPGFGCFQDIEDGIISTVLSPDKTLRPDPPRMVRAVRFEISKKFRLQKQLEDFMKTQGRTLTVDTF